MTMPWSNAGPSRGGLRRRSRPWHRGILAQHRLVVFEVVPADVARMRITYERRPFFPRQLVVLPMPSLPRATIHKGARVARVVEHPQGARVIERAPDHIAFARAVPEAARERPPLCAEVLDRCRRRAGAPEGRKEGPDRVLHALIGVEHDPARGIIDEADWYPGTASRRGGLCSGALPAAARGADAARLPTSCP